jgi:quinol monooxygenase YgiN
MIVFISHLKIDLQHEKTFESILGGVAAKVQAYEPDVLFYNFAKSADDPSVYVVVEVYRDAAAQAAHMTTEWVTTALPRAAECVVGVPDVRQYVSPGVEPIRDLAEFAP